MKLDIVSILKYSLIFYVAFNVIFMLNKLGGWFGGHNPFSKWLGRFADFSGDLLNDCTTQKDCGKMSVHAEKDQCDTDNCDFASFGSYACTPDEGSDYDRPGPDDPRWEEEEPSALCASSNNKAVMCYWAEIEDSRNCYQIDVGASCVAPAGRTVGEPRIGWFNWGCVFTWLAGLFLFFMTVGGLWAARTWSANLDLDMKNLASAKGTSAAKESAARLEKCNQDAKNEERKWEATKNEPDPKGYPSKKELEKMKKDAKTPDEIKKVEKVETLRNIRENVQMRATKAKYLITEYRAKGMTSESRDASIQYHNTDMAEITRDINDSKELDKNEKAREIEDAKERVEIIEK
jgi:hypothetical protein